MADSDQAASLVHAARALSPLVGASAATIEERRQLTPEVVEALAGACLFRLTIPRAVGGEEADPETIFRVIEEVSRADGSVGWCVMVTAANGMVSGLVEEEAAREIFAHDPGANAALVVITGGRAVAVDGGFRVTGRWRFASGCTHATWLGTGCTLYDGDTPRLDSAGAEEYRMAFLPASACQIIDTWHATGLRGTGSHDFTVDGVFVPDAHLAEWSQKNWQPRQPGPLYTFGFSMIPTVFAAVMLGIARNAIDTVEELAAVKTRGKKLLRDLEATQTHVAIAEADVGAARAYVLEAVRNVWEAATDGRAITKRQREVVRLACTHAATLSTQAVDRMWDAAGSSAIFTSSPLERCFRDIHTGRKNVGISAENYGPIGRRFLGLDQEVAPT
jgi:alkylation response protein AidB-like acyl-CoA dehydrogenase